jgi:hypothetical protein
MNFMQAKLNPQEMAPWTVISTLTGTTALDHPDFMAQQV